MDNGLPMGSLQCDIADLANKLRQERLFVTSEQQHLQTLNQKVVSVSAQLAQLAWVASQQRDNLNRLIVARADGSPAICCQKANTLEETKFVDAVKVLGFQNCMSYGAFLSALRDSPQLLASCLAEGDRVVPQAMHEVIRSLAAGLFGSALFPGDKQSVLRLLRHLCRLQLAPSDNPRRLLRKKCCAFSRLYGELHESLFSAKLFLTAALHYPIMQLLVDHDVFLDIDPDKATVRFSPEDRLKRFGVEGSVEYAERLQDYRRWTVGRLAAVTSRFLSSLRDNMHCFPPGVGWLVRQMAAMLVEAGRVQPKEVSAICTDLVLTHFVCPAIVNPEPYGITDAPISYIARFNLIQVATIVQTLAMTRYEEIDPKLQDLYSQFDKDCVSCLLDSILAGDGDEGGEGPAGGMNTGDLQGLFRTSALFTETELHNLVCFLQAVCADWADGVDKKALAELLQQLPAAGLKSQQQQQQQQQQQVAGSTPPDHARKMGGLLGKVGKARLRNTPPSEAGADEKGEAEEVRGEDVLIIPFSTNTPERVGFLTEHKVLCMGDQVDLVSTAPLEAEVGVAEVGGGSGSGGSEGQEKRSRALSHDDGSIGNTSDNLEAVSEAASNHSVASSLELETEDQNDNLSDMVSANVSGRGTPNISGRDTPSSQVTEGDEGVGGGGGRGAGMEPRQLDFRAPSVIKQTRSDIDDKFCKFEIKKLLEGDETVMSMVSDTWSTDVLASDSETVEQSDPPRLPAPPDPADPPDVSETASEAWSIDVLVSDTERLTEVDTDDTGSMARSDDTARSEVEDTPPPNLAMSMSGFRPIPAPLPAPMPASPTRVDIPHGGVWNVTGRGGGKADYRRRVVEYVDSNRRDRENQPNLAKPAPMRRGEEAADGDKPPPHKPPPVPGSLVSPAETSSQSLTSQCNGDLVAPAAAPSLVKPTAIMLSLVNGNHAVPPLVNGSPVMANHVGSRHLPSTRLTMDASNSKVDLMTGADASDASDPDPLIRLSSASLASSSSSGSGSDPRPHTVTPTPATPHPPATTTPVRVNGHAKSLLSLSTGAIPKSISFDKTAERGDKDLLDDDQKHKRSFFRNFKLPFKNRRGKSLRGSEDLPSRWHESGLSADGDLRLRRVVSEESRCLVDTSDDILAKYRRKPCSDVDSADVGPGVDSKVKQADVEDARLTIDPLRVEESYAFADAKRKLRMVLSTADLQHGSASQGNGSLNELLVFLKLQLAEAINLQDRPLVAHLHETLRCVQLFDSDGCRQLFHSLVEEHRLRAPYISYLVRSRQALLSTLAHLDRLTERVTRDKDVCCRYLVAVCVNLFLERRDSAVQRFITEFQLLGLADEKMDLLDGFLQRLAADMEQDATWLVATECQLEQARTAVERAMMSRVYTNALYPNGDGDVARDQVLHAHMSKLAGIVTPNHKDLRIPSRFQYECPWASAQQQVCAMAAYKTPRDKLQCVLRCTATIMNLLAMADIPAADDFTPVLVYVLIKANPPALLSTVQYIDSFYASRLEGEDQYWWTQFCSAVEFIKTMDYTD